MRITSIVSITLFTVSAGISLFGLLKSRKASNSSFLRIFFSETLIISLLEIISGILVFFDTKLNDIKMEFIQRCTNSFSVIFQFALILTITYGWKVACWKIKESTYSNFNNIRTRRAVFISIVATLFCAQLIASIYLLIYLLIEGKTS